MEKIEVVRELQEIAIISTRALINELMQQKLDAYYNIPQPCTATEVCETAVRYDVQIRQCELYLEKAHELLKAYYGIVGD